MSKENNELREAIQDLEFYTKDGEAIDFIHPEHLDKIMELVEALIQQKQLEARIDELKNFVEYRVVHHSLTDVARSVSVKKIEDRLVQLSTPPKKEAV
jgi:hypothetical protein